MKKLIIVALSISLLAVLVPTLAAADDLEENVVKAEQTWRHAASGDYSAQERGQISQAFDHLQRAARDCDNKLVTAEAKHDQAAELGQECKKEWDSARSKLASVITSDNKAMRFSALPPEINSARMYSGPGSAPMMSAATAWDGLAAELGSAAASFSSVTTGLANGPWLGPAAAPTAH